MEDIALQQWYADISNSSMCVLYKLFKKNLNFEKYLLCCNNRDRISLTKFRCSNSKLPVYNRIYMYDSDLCTLCNLQLRGDEYHYVLICPYFRNRDQYLKQYYYTRPNLLKFEQLFVQQAGKHNLGLPSS